MFAYCAKNRIRRRDVPPRGKEILKTLSRLCLLANNPINYVLAGSLGKLEDRSVEEHGFDRAARNPEPLPL